MRIPYNSSRRALVTLVLGGLVACGENTGVDSVAVRVELTPARDSMTVGEVATPFTARALNARDERIADALFTWRSDQPFIASVDSLTGRVIAVQQGVAAITARTGLVSDTAEIFVIAAIALTLPVDTVILVPGDTFSIPVTLRVSGGGTPPSVTFGGGSAGVASIDPSTGLVTAIGEGVVGFTVQADTVTARGGIQVRVVADTLNGALYLGLSGGVDRRGRFASRGFNHPTDDGGSALQIVADGAAPSERLAILLTDSLTGPRRATLGNLTPADIGPGEDPVCLPPDSWAFYQDQNRTPPVTALSLAGGTVTLTSVTPITGGWAVGGRFRMALQLTDVTGIPGQVTATGTFAIPVVSLASCPK